MWSRQWGRRSCRTPSGRPRRTARTLAFTSPERRLSTAVLESEVASTGRTPLRSHSWMTCSATVVLPVPGGPWISVSRRVAAAISAAVCDWLRRPEIAICWATAAPRAAPKPSTGSEHRAATGLPLPEGAMPESRESCRRGSTLVDLLETFILSSARRWRPTIMRRYPTRLPILSARHSPAMRCLSATCEAAVSCLMTSGAEVCTSPSKGTAAGLEGVSSTASPLPHERTEGPRPSCTPNPGCPPCPMPILASWKRPPLPVGVTSRRRSARPRFSRDSGAWFWILCSSPSASAMNSMRLRRAYFVKCSRAPGISNSQSCSMPSKSASAEAMSARCERLVRMFTHSPTFTWYPRPIMKSRTDGASESRPDLHIAMSSWRQTSWGGGSQRYSWAKHHAAWSTSPVSMRRRMFLARPLFFPPPPLPRPLLPLFFFFLPPPPTPPPCTPIQLGMT
mmetsp:Transcript_63802/g.201820  ORF Transcript_63802/g.201820 Transcript_63802/m.201820 type:complete len:451 (-) Transcript_63802:361-1713(-)